nr:hypothetical protein GCM10025732_43600 [Glycomyces mayteni]
MFGMGSSVLLERLDPPPGPEEPGAPGPTAFADRDRLASILEGAGWAPRIEAFDFTVDYGYNGTDGVEERLTSVESGGVGRTARAQLLPRIGPDGWDALLDEVRAELRRHLVDGVLRFPGAVWLVDATNPR